MFAAAPLMGSVLLDDECPYQHTPVHVQHLLPSVASLSPQAHESTPTFTSISYRMVAQRLWRDSLAVLK